MVITIGREKLISRRQIGNTVSIEAGKRVTVATKSYPPNAGIREV